MSKPDFEFEAKQAAINVTQDRLGVVLHFLTADNRTVVVTMNLAALNQLHSDTARELRLS